MVNWTAGGGHLPDPQIITDPSIWPATATFAAAAATSSGRIVEDWSEVREGSRGWPLWIEPRAYADYDWQSTADQGGCGRGAHVAGAPLRHPTSRETQSDTFFVNAPSSRLSHDFDSNTTIFG